MTTPSDRPGSGFRRALLALGRRADILGWLLIGWPLFFLAYNEIHREGIRNLTWAEILAYGVPVFALPLVGHLVKNLIQRHERQASTSRYLQNVIDNMGDLLVILDRDRRIVFGNHLLDQYFGDVVGRHCYEVFEDRQDICDECPEKICLEEGKSLKIRRRRSVGYFKERWFEININPFRDFSGEIIGMVEIWRDINARVHLEEKLREQALTDGLTRLFNARAFFQAFPSEMKRARRMKHPLTLLMLDIDRFKQYNDSHGHPAGDRVLKGLGKVIQEQVRKDVDSGYRYGGDEFAVILPYLSLNEARNVAERISRSFVDLGYPEVSLSVGILMMEGDLSMHQMVDMVDSAMYKAKSMGGNRVYVHGT